MNKKNQTGNHTTLSLDELLSRFNRIGTWTKEKKDLKSQITKQVSRDNIYTFNGSKHLYKLNRFGETRKMSSQELFLLIGKKFDSPKVELLCLGQEHCVFMHIAARELPKLRPIIIDVNTEN